MTRGEVELEFFQKAGGLDEHIVMMMADEIVRLRAILAALREPSEKVLLAAVEAVPYGASYAALMHCIPAAVAAAEREVASE